MVAVVQLLDAVPADFIEDKKGNYHETNSQASAGESYSTAMKTGVMILKHTNIVSRLMERQVLSKFSSLHKSCANLSTYSSSKDL